MIEKPPNDELKSTSSIITTYLRLEGLERAAGVVVEEAVQVVRPAKVGLDTQLAVAGGVGLVLEVRHLAGPRLIRQAHGEKVAL